MRRVGSHTIAVSVYVVVGYYRKRYCKSESQCILSVLY
jgi:hypothetical protein